MPEIPTAAEIRAIVREAVQPLREELAQLRARLDEETISLADAARRRGVSVRALQRMVKRGELPAVKGGPTGRGLRVRLGDILPANAEDLARGSRDG